jgi:hypothetical protein
MEGVPMALSKIRSLIFSLIIMSFICTHIERAQAGLAIYDPTVHGTSGGGGDGPAGSNTPDSGMISISVSNGLGGNISISAPTGTSVSVSIGADGAVSFSSQSSGQYLSQEEIRQVVSELKVRKDTQLLSARYVNEYSASSIPCPLTRLGLMGVSIGVADNVASSFYFKDQDLIVLSKKEMDLYGLAILDHELIHAGLTKAKKSKSISNSEYNYLARLNRNTFSSLNGYVGLAQGAYTVDGYAYQEAMAYGWGMAKLKKYLRSVTTGTQREKIALFVERFQNNEFLRHVNINGKNRPIFLVDSRADRILIRDFIREFLANAPIRQSIDIVQNKVKKQLPKLCLPGKEEIIEGGCFSYSIRKCGENMRWQTTYQSSCGDLR